MARPARAIQSHKHRASRLLLWMAHVKWAMTKMAKVVKLNVDHSKSGTAQRIYNVGKSRGIGSKRFIGVTYRTE